MIPAISTCIVNGQIILLGIGGQPLQEGDVKSRVYQSNLILVTPNREKTNLSDYWCMKDTRRKKNTKAKANDNKWKSRKRCGLEY